MRVETKYKPTVEGIARKNSKGVLLEYPKQFEWANINNIKREDLHIKNKQDWIQLCSSCHRIFDYYAKLPDYTI